MDLPSCRATAGIVWGAAGACSVDGVVRVPGGGRPGPQHLCIPKTGTLVIGHRWLRLGVMDVGPYQLTLRLCEKCGKIKGYGTRTAIRQGHFDSMRGWQP